MIEEISGKVGEGLVTREEVAALQKKYQIGNVYQGRQGLKLRLVADELPEGFVPVTDHIDLEDVYLYYLEGQGRGDGI